MSLQFGDVGQQFIFAGQPAEVEADRLVSSQRRLVARPETDQQARDDGTIGLDLNAVLAVTQQMSAPKYVLEK